MKRIIFAVVILASILGAGIWENMYVHETFTEFDNQMNAVIVELKNENSDGALQKLNSTFAWWEEKKRILEIFSYSQDLRLISSCLGETKGSLEVGDMQNAMSKSVSILTISKYTHEILDFNIEDII